jgi:acetyl-CoA carboxylase biotin carboxyl carrier protein
MDSVVDIDLGPNQGDAPDGGAGASAAQWESHLQTLRALADVVREARLSELEIEDGGVRLSLKSPAGAKRQAAVSGDYHPEHAAIVHDEWHLAPAAALPGVEANEDEPIEEGLLAVVSPMTGTFYRAPSPSEPNFVDEGDHVEVGQALGLVETMKVFNEITSEVEGTVVSIGIAASAEVGTGDVLMTIRTV